LPGAPVLVVGSNGQVAWALTNGEFDTCDVVVIELDPQAASRYLTPAGPRVFERYVERIHVRGQRGDDDTLEVVETVWGPVVGKDAHGHLLARHWTALEPATCNFNLRALETAPDVPAALDAAARVGLPFQNFLCADRAGHIGWTAFGALPARVAGFDGRLPSAWRDGRHGWTTENAGLLPPSAHPRALDPAAGLLWSANQRPLSEANPDLIKIGVQNSYDRGARARQIRDDLRALDHPATPADLLAIQLDDRALFLERWHALLLTTLDSPTADLANHPARAALREIAAHTWTGRASVDSASYRLVRTFRAAVSDRVLEPFVARCRQRDRAFVFPTAQWEGPLWQLLTVQPAHLLDARFPSWDALLLAAVDSVLADPAFTNQPLERATWGQRNTARIRHPFSYLSPLLGPWLDAPRDQIPGDRDLPRAQGPDFGASERLIVAPGHEEDGIFEMPGGQSGHPFSPHYLDGHAAWVRGEPTPLLPGPTVETLTLLRP
ncbi:MAG: penicillin acylase family protein, partial [Verrucomicrobia bacterium]|nr:penicillin acylase family protein [Verrucomicrobiota bacterium]